jgi:hypothetical protein
VFLPWNAFLHAGSATVPSQLMSMEYKVKEQRDLHSECGANELLPWVSLAFAVSIQSKVAIIHQSGVAERLCDTQEPASPTIGQQGNTSFLRLS